MAINTSPAPYPSTPSGHTRLTESLENVSDFTSSALSFLSFLQHIIKNAPWDLTEEFDCEVQLGLDIVRSCCIVLFTTGLLLKPEKRVLVENWPLAALTLLSGLITLLPLLPGASFMAQPAYTIGKIVDLLSSVNDFYHAREELHFDHWLQKKLLQQAALNKAIAGSPDAARQQTLQARIDKLNTLITARARVFLTTASAKQTAGMLASCEKQGLFGLHQPPSPEEQRMDRQEKQNLNRLYHQKQIRLVRNFVCCLAMVAISCALLAAVPVLNAVGFTLMVAALVIGLIPFVERCLPICCQFGSRVAGNCSAFFHGSNRSTSLSQALPREAPDDLIGQRPAAPGMQ